MGDHPDHRYRGTGVVWILGPRSEIPEKPCFAMGQGVPSQKRVRRAGIIGAGLVGTALAREFVRRRDLGLQAVAFFDDDRMKWGRRVQDIPIVGAPESLLNGKGDLELEEVIIAMPSAPARRIAELLPWDWQPITATRAAA